MHKGNKTVQENILYICLPDKAELQKGERKMNSNLLTVTDICSELCVCKNTAYALIRNKKIRATKVGKRYLTNRAELDKYISNTMLKVK